MGDNELLAGVRVLVVEDDFFLALDEQSSLEDAGAHVIGPYADEAAGVSAAQGPIDCAVLDLNFGNGPSFKIATALRAEDVPFLFVTGYDARVIPLEFSNVLRLQKPVNTRDLIQAVANIFRREPTKGAGS